MPQPTTRRPIDVAIVVALDKDELAPLETAIGVPLRPTRTRAEVYHEFEFRTLGGARHRALILLLGDMGIQPAERMTSELLRDYDVRLLVSIGISGAATDDVKIGDVVVATSCWDYLYRAKVASKRTGTSAFDEIIPDGQTLPTTYGITNTFFKNLTRLYSKEWEILSEAHKRRIETKLPRKILTRLSQNAQMSLQPSIHLGEVASGILVANEDFKAWLRAHHRKVLAVDMESFGVLLAANRLAGDRPPPTVVIRAMSDGANADKALLDRAGGILRACAIQNAIGTLEILLRHLDEALQPGSPPEQLPGPSSDLAYLVNSALNATRSHIPAQMQDLSPHAVSEWLPLYNRFLRFFSIPSSLLNQDDPRLVEQIYTTLQRSKSEIPLEVDGPAGVGMSEFLAALYLYAVSRVLADPACPFPVFLSLTKYNSYIYNERKGPIANQAEEHLRADLKPLTEAITRFPNQNFLLIVDGYGEPARFADHLVGAILDCVHKAKHQKIIGLRWTRESSAPHREPPRPNGWMPEATLSFAQFSTTAANNEELVDSFLLLRGLHRNSNVRQFMLSAIASERLSSLDLYTLDLIADEPHNRKPGDQLFITDLLDAACRRYLASQSRRPGDAPRDEANLAKLAYDWEMTTHPDAALPKRRLEQTVGWDLLHIHATMRDFLVAKHVSTAILAIGASIPKTGHLTAKQRSRIRQACVGLANVYPHRINRFCKDLVNNSVNSQQFVLQAASPVFKLGPVRLKAHVCYLLGRLAARPCRLRAKGLLEDFLQTRTPADGTKDRELLHAIRTAYISLAYLGSEEHGREYIERLTEFPEWDDLNRGFHLEYYGDIEFSAAAGLLHQDPLEPFPRTFWELHRRLHNRANNPLFELELYTLLSLAQHRLEAPPSGGKETLSLEKRRHLLDLWGHLRDRVKATNASLADYGDMVISSLKAPAFSVGTIVEDLYFLKLLERTGWTDQRVTCRTESVADHTFAAMLLAEVLLPPTLARKDYSKQSIIEMLLVHDVAEKWIGDRTLKDDVDREKEREVYRWLAMLGTYKSISGLRTINAIWKEFEEGQSYNASIARDFDKLENLVQLFVYRKAGQELPDFAQWRRDLPGLVFTDIGKAARRFILRHFEGSSSAAEDDSSVPR
jgi:nucleoside phosphorylase/5'-deoxynucleotidase YfbR-like HD superfamily hydrolase